MAYPSQHAAVSHHQHTRRPKTLQRQLGAKRARSTPPCAHLQLRGIASTQHHHQRPQQPGGQPWQPHALRASTQRLRRHTTIVTASANGGAPPAVAAPPASAADAEAQVLAALRNVIDPDFGEDVVACGFVKGLTTDTESGEVTFALELTTPACPVKEQFKREAEQYVGALPWVSRVNVSITAQPAKNTAAMGADPGAAGRPGGLRDVRHVIAVSSCKGGVGKSTTAVNLAFTLAQMGAKVGIFDADVYGPSLPTMVSPEVRVLLMDADTRAITPTEYEGVKLVSFGFAGQGSAIMRGAMVSGLITQLLTTSEWGSLDYLVLDFPPGTGDIQLTICQSVAIDAAVVVTTPQKLAYVDVAKGVRMFARLAVPCVAVVENMSYFDGTDGTRYRPFGEGSGDRIKDDFGIPNIIRFPIVPELSAAGDTGVPLVVGQPAGDVAGVFMELGATVVREVARMGGAGGRRPRVEWEAGARLFVVRPAPGAGGEPFYLEPQLVRANDTSARAVDEWTGERLAPEPPPGVAPLNVVSLGNYAVQISWDDGANQVAPYEVLDGLRQQAVPTDEAARRIATAAAGDDPAEAEVGGMRLTAELSG